jgi:hypothetical protein
MKYKVIELETETVNVLNSMSAICDTFNLSQYEVWWLLNDRYLQKTKLFKRMQDLIETYRIYTVVYSDNIEDIIFFNDMMHNPKEIKPETEPETGLVELVEKPKNIVKEYINQIENKIKNKNELLLY